jgi:3-isopropylmalate dehydrogenase
VYGVVKEGIKTKDIGGNKTTMEFTQQVISKLF